MPAHHLMQRRGAQQDDEPAVTKRAPGPEVTMIVKVDENESAAKEANVQTDPNPAPTVTPNASASSTEGTVLAIATDKAKPGSETFDELANSSSLPKPEDNEPTHESGTSAGVKAGIAFGVIAAALLFGWLIFFLVGRRKKHANEKRKRNKKNKIVDTEKQQVHRSDKPAVARAPPADVAINNHTAATMPNIQAVNKPLPYVDELAPPMPAA